MFKMKIIKDNRCKKHLCQDPKHPAIYRCSETLYVKIQRTSPLLTKDMLKQHPNHSWMRNI